MNKDMFESNYSQVKHRWINDTYCSNHKPKSKMDKVVQCVGAGVNIFLRCPECGRRSDKNVR